MAYTHITQGQLKTELSARLGDPLQRFWSNNELGVLIQESLRTFGIASGFWRERGVLSLSAGTAFYSLDTELPNILGYTVTDYYLIQCLQYSLLESVASQQSWSGTEMFALSDLVESIERRRNQFLSDTGIVLTRSLMDVSPSSIGRHHLDQSIIDVRRAAWVGAPPENYYTNLWREDERSLTASNASWSVNQGQPAAFSIMAPPPLEMQIAPPPMNAGQVELITVNSGTPIAAGDNASVLGIPDDLSWIVKWGALADLLGSDGESRDMARAQYAEQRYRQGVELAKLLPVVLNGEINGVPLITDDLQSVDGRNPNWQNAPGTPTTISVLGANMIAISPVPDDIYSVTLDVVRRAPLPAHDGAPVQVGREQLDMILDYAEHVALFKVGGEEWMATQRQADNAIIQAMTYNRRLSAAARYVVAARETSLRENYRRPRQLDGIGIGSLQ